MMPVILKKVDFNTFNEDMFVAFNFDAVLSKEIYDEIKPPELEKTTKNEHKCHVKSTIHACIKPYETITIPTGLSFGNNIYYDVTIVPFTNFTEEQACTINTNSEIKVKISNPYSADLIIEAGMPIAECRIKKAKNQKVM